MTLGIRPEHVGVRSGGGGDVALPVRLVEPLGKDTLLYFDDGSERAFVAVSEGFAMAGCVRASRSGSRSRRSASSVRAGWPSPRPNFRLGGDCMELPEVSEIRDGMRIDWDMPITMEDGIVLRCDIYRLIAQGRYPVIMTYGPYGKWLHFEDLYTEQWRRMCEDRPDVPTGSTNKYQCWEVVDPEKWVPDGYVVIRVDSRGAGRSPGVIDIWSRREAIDQARGLGGRAAVVERQGGIERHLLLRREPVAVRGTGPGTSPPSARGRAPPTSTATWRITAASSATASLTTGRARRSTRCSTGAAGAASRAA